MEFYEISPSGHPSYYWVEYPEKGTRDVYRVSGVRKRGDTISDYVWSSRMIDVLTACKSTGYSARPVRIYRGHQELKGYMRIRIVGKGGPFDSERSRAVYGSRGGLIGHDCVYMAEEQWDGSDIFKIPGLGGAIFATGRVTKELMKVKLTNVTFTLSTECKM